MKALLLSLLLAVAISAPGIAQTVPSGMTYQGRLTDATNAPAPDGTGYEIEVRLWSASTGGTLLWGTRYTGVPLKSGAFNLILGSGGTPIAGATTTDLKTAFNSPVVHLGITTTKSGTGAPIPSPTEILPRQQIFSTPYAFRAGISAAVDNDTITSQAIKDGEVRTADLANEAVTNTNIAPGAVDASKIALQTITGTQILQFSIGADRLSRDLAYIIDEKPQGTGGGASSGNSWVKRTLNKVAYNLGPSISLNTSTSTFTLAKGVYLVEAQTPGYSCWDSKAVIRRSGEATLVLTGTTEHSDNGNTSHSAINGFIIVTGASESFEIWQYIESGSSNALGDPSNITSIPEVYTTVKISRIQ